MIRSYDRLHLLILALALLSGCGEKKEASSQAPPPAVGVVNVMEKAVTPGASFVGRVEAIKKVDVRARVQGFLEKRLFTEGQDVKEGDSLFLIERAQYEAQVDQAKADLARAEAEAANTGLQLRRAQELLRTNNIPAATVDERAAADRKAQAGVLEAKAALRQAEINLSYTEINAAITGRIGRSRFSVGNLVGPDSGVLATIVSQDPMYVTFPVSSREVLEFRRHSLQEGAPPKVVAHITLPDGRPYPHDGTLDFIDVQVSRETDTITVRAEFPNPDRLLVDGQFANVTVERAQPQPALVVPQAAIQRDQAGPFVLVVGGDKKVEVRRVQTGASQGGQTVIQDGLKEGETIIVQGVQKVRPGQVVDPSPAAPTGA